MAKLESLIVDLQVNTAALQSGLDDANRKLEDFDKALKDLAGVVVFEKFAKMAASAVSSLVNFAMHGAEAADRMGKLAQAAGTTVESFSRLAYAGELSGVGADELGAAMVKLDVNMSKAAAGGKEQAAVFAALGVKITDSAGKMRSSDAVMADLADRFSGMADGAAKTKLAIDLFGKAGAEMIPMLNGGRDGLAELAAEADKFGITVSSSAAAAAEAFNDNLQKLKLAATAVGQRVAAQLAPALTTITDELLSSGEGAEFLKDAAWLLAGVLKTLASVGVMLGAIFQVIGKTLARVASAVMDAARGDFTAAKTLIADVGGDVVAAAEKTKATLKNMWESSEAPAKAARQTHGRTAEAIVADAEAMKKAATEAEQAFKALEKVALKDSKLAGELNFGLARESAQTSRQVADRATQFSQIGMTNTERATANTQGFASFDHALSTLARQTQANAELLAQAEWFKAHGETESAQASLLAADEHKRAAELAGRAADAFEELAKENLARQKEIASMAVGVISQAGQSGAEVGKLITSAMQGFQAGGIWGAIIAVIANLFAKLESVGKFIDSAFSSFMEVFSQLNDSFSILFESLTKSLIPVMKILGVAFKAVNDILVPVFQTLETIRQPFADLASGFTDLLKSTGIFDWAVKAVSAVFTVVGLVISGIVLGLQYVWDGILKAVRGVMAFFGASTSEIDETIKKHEQAIEQTKANMTAAAASIGKDRISPTAEITTTGDVTATGEVKLDGDNGMKPFDLSKYGLGGGSVDVIDIGGWGYAAGTVAGAEAAKALVEQIALINGMTSEAAAALGQQAYDDFLALGDAAGSAAASLDTLSQSLTNVPSGFRYAAAAFNSQDVGGAAPVSGGGDGPMYVTVHGNVWTVEELLVELENARTRKGYQKHGIGDNWR